MTEQDNQNNVGHKVIETFKSGNIVARVFEKVIKETNKVYYDFSIARQYHTPDGEPKYSSKLQQRDFDDLMYVILDAKLFIREKVFNLRKDNE